MSEIYKRSLGQTFDERALRIELDNGTAGYDNSGQEYIRPLDTLAVASYRQLEEVAEAQAQLYLAEQAMAENWLEHPKYSWHVGKILTERLDALAAEGHPVDAEMYLEAQDLANEIVAANPDKNAEELTQIVTDMIQMIQAQYTLRQYTLAA